MFPSLLILLAILLLVGALVLGVTLFMMANMLLRPPRMTDGKAAFVLRRLSPGDLGLPFEEKRIDVRDQRTGKLLPIATWWIPHLSANGRCVVLIHGYADAKVGAIAWAPLWHDLGYNILALDLRAHGESGGKHTTAGDFERHDLDQVLNAYLAERGDEMRQIVLFGVSLGAAVALGTAVMRDDIDALVLECPFAEYRKAVAAHAQILQSPLPALAPAAIRLAEWRSGARLDAVRPVELLRQVDLPVLVIQSCEDPLVPPDDVEAIRAAVRAQAERGIPSHHWLVPEAGHVTGIISGPDEYRSRIAAFIAAAERSRGAGPIVDVRSEAISQVMPPPGPRR